MNLVNIFFDLLLSDFKYTLFLHTNDEYKVDRITIFIDNRKSISLEAVDGDFGTMEDYGIKDVNGDIDFNEIVKGILRKKNEIKKNYRKKKIETILRFEKVECYYLEGKIYGIVGRLLFVFEGTPVSRRVGRHQDIVIKRGRENSDFVSRYVNVKLLDLTSVDKYADEVFKAVLGDEYYEIFAS